MSSLILDTLRIDVRCRALFYLDASMKHVRHRCLFYSNHSLTTLSDAPLGQLQLDLRGF
jgi:hypothetical protein